jgi:WD40 repeat protein
MNNPFQHRVAAVSVLLSLSLFTIRADQSPERSSAAPRSTSAGILFSDQRADGLFLLTGSGIDILSTMPGSGLYFTVSPDGNSVGYKEVYPDGKQSAVLYHLEQRRTEVLQRPASRVGQISFSDDGTIAFTEGEHLVILSNGVRQRYDLGTYANIAPISPDGRFVVYNDDRDQLWLLDVKNSVRKQITRNDGSYALPQWSPDGSQVLYTSLSGSMFVFSLRTGGTVLLGTGAAPSWMNDTEILYTQTQSEREEIIASDLFIVRSDGASRRQTTFTPDRYEDEASFDHRTHSIVYADLKRGGLYSRRWSPDALAEEERPLFPADDAFLRQPRAARTASPSSPSTTAAVYFEMPYVHQVWDTPDWYNGHSACGATSSIMVIAYFNIVPKWNVWCSPSGSSPGHYSPYGNYVCERYTYREYSYGFTANDPNGKPSFGGYGFMWSGGYSPYSRTVEYYTNHGMSAVRYDSNAAFFATVIANVDSGYPFTLCNGLTTAGHIIVVNGYDLNNRTLIVNDPYGNKNTGVYPSLNGKGVKYDWVGYNNGYRNLNRIYWGVSVRYALLAQADSVVDDAHLNKGFYLHTSAPSSLTQWFDKRTGGYMNGHFWWTRTKASDTCYATWTPTLAKSGWYAVSAYIPYSDATKARYVIAAKDSVRIVVVDQKPVKNNWVLLGTFPFAAGASGSVRLGDGSDTLKQGIVFDAVKWTYIGDGPLSVERTSSQPKTVVLEQNYPNPFNPETTIEFTLPQRSRAVLRITDLLGKEVARIADGELDAGTHRYRFSAEQHGLSSGVYLCTLHAGAATQTKRMIILK